MHCSTDIQIRTPVVVAEEVPQPAGSLLGEPAQVSAGGRGGAAFLLLLLIISGLCSGQGSSPTESSAAETPKPIWYQSFAEAVRAADLTFRPMLVFFSSASCSWCHRFRSDVLTREDVQELLAPYALIELDANENQELAAHYLVRGVPTVILLSADGQERSRVGGYVEADAFKKVLNGLLGGTAPGAKRKREVDTLLAAVREARLPDEQWPDLVLALGEEEHRGAVRQAILELGEFPRAQLVALLKHAQLPVRVGALDLLEEAAGETFGFDPWFGEDVGSDQPALGRWESWAAGGKKDRPGSMYAGLTREQVRELVGDLLSDSRGRASRARRMLHQGGGGTAAVLTEILTTSPDLPQGMREAVRELRYAILIPPTSGVDPGGLAHRLVFANVDTRLQAIRDLEKVGRAALPILRDLLGEDDPLIREATIDALAAVGRRGAVVSIEEHLRSEADFDVIFAAVRALGGIRSKRSLLVLMSYLESGEEDLVIAALEGLAKLRSTKAEPGVRKAIADKRWRVRVAAIKAAATLDIDGITEEIGKRCHDEDEFVRFTAVDALATLESKGAAKELEALFHREDALKGPVIAAFGKLDLPLPKSFVAPLNSLDPPILLGIVSGLQECGKRALVMAHELTHHRDDDVAAAALALLARHGMGKTTYRETLSRTLASGSPPRIRSVLESVRGTDDSFDDFRTGNDEALLDFANGPLTTPTGAAGSEGEPSNLSELFDTFLGPDSATPRPEQQETRAKSDIKDATGLEDLVGLFLGTGSKPPSSAKEDGGMNGAPMELRNAIKRHAEDNSDPETRFAAALALARMGDGWPIPFLQEKLPQLRVSDRVEVAKALRRVAAREGAVELTRVLLRDPGPEVRREAVESAGPLLTKRVWQDLFLSELLREGARLRPHELCQWAVFDSIRKARGMQGLRQRLVEILVGDGGSALKTLAIILLEHCGKPQDESVLSEFVTGSNVWHRRAALHALGKVAPKAYRAVLPKVVSDPAPEVRAVIPGIALKEESSWVHYFDDKDTVRDPYSWYGSGSRMKLSGPERKALEALVSDPVPKIRMQAMFALLEAQVPIDLNTFVHTLDQVPDQEAVAERVGEFIRDRYRRMGPAFAVLLRYLEQANLSEVTIREIEEHFNVDPESGDSGGAKATDLTYVTRQGNLPLTAALTPVSVARPEAEAGGLLRLVYFTKAGCPDCARVTRLVAHLGELFPELEVAIYRIETTASLRLNEALCQHFGVPEKRRLVAPAVFCAAGGLVKSEITIERLGRLLTDAVGLDQLTWANVDETTLATSEEAIEKRFGSLSVAVVLGAGLVDGINPCAFATMIFLLSYLQIARRRPREIAQVAGAFILAVFITYFALGLGLSEVVGQIMAFQLAGAALHWGMAALVALAMVLSIRDGVLCLKGRMADMTLQLPGALKERIRGVVRTGARHRRFVVSAFLAGVAVSVLELACTGQVYAPTILYVLRGGGRKAGALGYLVIYNLAFVAPLIVVFVAACSGMTSQRLADRLVRHAASVKFATALLFLALLVLLLLSPA